MLNLALTLVAAMYQESTWVRLTFDRPINFAGLDGSAITVNDEVLSVNHWAATGAATLVGPAIVQIELTELLPSVSGDQVLLTATAGSGIVAVDDGGAWAGVNNLSLPFP